MHVFKLFSIFSFVFISVKAPSFFEAMGPITLIQTKGGVIPCPVDAAPLPTVSWKKDKLVLDIAGDDNLVLAANKRDLVIINVTAVDKGEYTCRAKNNLGSVQGTSEVNIGGNLCVFLHCIHA